MTRTNVLSSLRKAIKTSSLAAVAKARVLVTSGRRKSVLFGNAVRPVSVGCLGALEACGCTCDDWSRVLVVTGFDPVNIANVRFIGDVVLGNLVEPMEIAPGVTVPAGIVNATISNCEIGNNCFVHDVGLLANTVVADGAIVWRCDLVATAPEATFGNGIELPIAIETGGRELLTFAEMTVADAETVCTSRADKKLQADYARLISQYLDAVRSDRGTIGAAARVVSTPKVLNTYVGPGAVIDNARLVENVTLLSQSDEKARITEGAYVRNSLLQWGAEVSSMAIVDESVMVEHSHVERHGKVTQSLLGPNTGVAEGEITASLCGPFVGFHHQALLIATFWPEGKGNVSHGADVGSNHTSRSPDQEFWPGEGTFFGLGVNIKFPSNFTKAPYSLIATAVTTLPQKITFPFSLITPPAAALMGMSPAYNEIIPAWVLSDNIFAIRRNEGKYKKRNKARRSTFVFDIFRPDIVNLMLDARKCLQNPEHIRDLYTGDDIEGLGKNYMLEPNRLKAIETYTFYIRTYALLGLKTRLEGAGKSKSARKMVLSKRTTDRTWEHQRRILVAEFGQDADVPALLKELSKAQQRIARDTQKSKEKDDQRGERIIDDYSEVHTPAAQNAFVKETWEVTRKMQKEIRALLARLK